MQEGWCFKCRLQGHMARECPTKVTHSSNSDPATNSHIQTGDATTDDEMKTTKPEDMTVRTAMAAPKLTQAQ